MLFLLNAFVIGFVELSSTLLASDSSSFTATNRTLYFFIIISSFIHCRVNSTAKTSERKDGFMGLGFDLATHYKVLNGLMCGVLFPFALFHVYWRHAHPGVEMSAMMTSSPFVGELATIVCVISVLYVWFEHVQHSICTLCSSCET